MKKTIIALTMAFLTLFTACQKEELKLDSFELSTTTLTLEEGQETMLRITVKPVYSDMIVTWKSSDPSVATVVDGKVTAVKAGKATITASNSIDKSKTATCQVTVEEKVVLNSLSIVGPEDGVVYVGIECALGIEMEPQIPDLTFVWSTNDASTIDVNPETGVVKGIKDGNATITLTCTDFDMNATIDLVSETKVLGGGKGSAADPFKITSIDDYKKLLSLSSGTVPDELKKYAFEAASYILVNDIDFSAQSDTLLPLFGSATTPFIGSFDGNNKTITGLAVRRDSSSVDAATGMFGYLGHGAMVKNLVLDNLWVKSSYMLCGGVAGMMAGATIDNVDITGGKVEDTANGTGEGSFIRSIANAEGGEKYETLYKKGHAILGGIAGSMESSTIRNCSVAATVYASQRCVGGIVGSMLGSGNLVTDCTVESNSLIHSSQTFAGGISSSIRSGSTINNCTVKALVESSYSYSAGIAAEGEGGTITNCTLDGASVALLKNGSNYVGGVISYGRNGEFTISGCTIKNSAVYATGTFSGGVCGKLDSKTSIKDCHITDNSQIKIGMYGGAGIAGQLNNGTIEDCSLEKSSVQVFGFYASNKAQSNRAGGIAGYINGGVSIKDCLVSESTVEVKNYEGEANADGNEAGGIVGLVSTGSVTGCKVLDSEIIAGAMKCGGIAASADTEVRIENCYVDEKTQLSAGKNCCGGILSWLQTKSGKSIIVNNCVAKCKQTATNSVAGIVGFADAKATNGYVLVINCAEIGGELIGTAASDNNCGGLMGYSGTTKSADYIYLVNCAALQKSINAATKTAGGIYGNNSYDNFCWNVYTPADYNDILINGNPSTSSSTAMGAVSGWSRSEADGNSFKYVYSTADVKVLGGGTPKMEYCETHAKAKFTDGTLLDKLNANLASVNAEAILTTAGCTAAQWVAGADGYPVPSGLPSND